MSDTCSTCAGIAVNSVDQPSLNSVKVVSLGLEITLRIVMKGLRTVGILKGFSPRSSGSDTSLLHTLSRVPSTLSMCFLSFVHFSQIM